MSDEKKVVENTNEKDVLGRIEQASKNVADRIEVISKENDELKGRVKYLEDNKSMDRKEGVKPISFSRLFGGLVSGNMDGYEREIKQEGDKLAREMGIAATADGGALVPSQYLPQEFIEQLRAQIVTAKLGARVLDGLTGSPVLIPKVAGGATVYWVGENGSKTPSDLTMDQLSLTPHEAACLTKVSNRLMQLSNPSIDTLLANDMGAAIARAVDSVALLGTGLNNQPTGLLNWDSIGTYTLTNDAGSGATPIAADVADMVYTLEVANGAQGSVGWASNPRFFNTLAKLRAGAEAADTTAGPFLYRDELKGGMLEGFPIAKSSQIPINIVKGGSGATSSYAFLGNWNDLMVAYWGGVEFRVSKDAGDAFQYNQTWIRASILVDVAVRNEGSFVVVDGVLA